MVIVGEKLKGRPDDEFFNQPISSQDHPFLRQFAHSDAARNSQGQLEPSKEALAAMRKPGESELDYYERRYQERVSLPIKHFYFNVPVSFPMDLKPN